MLRRVIWVVRGVKSGRIGVGGWVVESTGWRGLRWNSDGPLSEIRRSLARLREGRRGDKMGGNRREKEGEQAMVGGNGGAIRRDLDFGRALQFEEEVDVTIRDSETGS